MYKYFYLYSRTLRVLCIYVGTYIHTYIYTLSHAIPTIKGPDNPTSQLLPTRNKSCSGTGKEGKTKEVVEDREVKKVVCEELCVIKLCVKDACDTIMCVKGCVQ